MKRQHMDTSQKRICGKFFSPWPGAQSQFLIKKLWRYRWINEWNQFKTIPDWDVKKGRPKYEVICQAKKDGKTVHFANLIDLCHLKNAELATHFQKYKGRVVLRGRMMSKTKKDTEQFS